MNQGFNVNNIYNIYYSDQGSFFNSVTVGRPLHNGMRDGSYVRERDIIELSLDPNDPHLDDYFSFAFNNSDVSFTLGLDYRHLNNHVIGLLINAYNDGYITGIRILPRGKKLTREIFNMLNVPDLGGMLVSVDEIENDVDLNSSYIDVRNGRGIVTIENTSYTNSNYNFFNNYNIHINRELSDEELQYIVELLNENSYQNIIVDFYEPTYYRHMLEFFSDKSIPIDVTFRFLTNPLYDVASLYDGLDEIIPNKIDIEYNTCNDLNDYYREEPISEGIRYYSDIEAGGRTDVETYNDMLEMIDSVVRHMEDMNYSPLEKVTYLYDYFKEHYHYNDSGVHADNSYLDRIYSKDEMICEGFSNLFSAILRRAGVLCFTYGTSDHQKNIIRITDPKYGVDNIALIDPTWDLDHKDNRNVFDNLLLNIDNNLYLTNGSEVGESISIPTAFLIDHQDYANNLLNSNPGYVINPFGYGIRMLQLMGLDVNQNSYVVGDEESRYNAYRDAILNSNLINNVDSNAIADAITNVREREGEYVTSNDKDNDREDVYDNVSIRGADHSRIPCIRENIPGGRVINVGLHVPQTDNSFRNIPAQNTVLNYPRQRLVNESEEDYFNYLHNYYYGRFINGEPPITIDDDSTVYNHDDIPINNNSDDISTNDNHNDDIEEDDYMFEITNPDGLDDYDSHNNSNNSNNNQSSTNISNDSTSIDSNHNQIGLEGNENGEYIPGTNILKPRDRYPYETDNEYIDYLAAYYEQFFPQSNNTQQNNDSREIITIYSDESTNLLYVEDEVATRFNLSSASFPAQIGDKFCYRISREDAEKLADGRDDTVLPYDVVIKSFTRQYDRTDDEYLNFDNQGRHR